MRTAADIAELSLRQIGVYSPYDSGSDPAEFAVALEYLDLMLAQWVGERKYWWFVPANQTINLLADTPSYDVAALVTDNRLQFVTNAHIIEVGKTQRQKLTLIRRSQFESEYDPETTGTPDRIYIERNDSPQAYLLPTPNTAYTLELSGSKYSRNVMDDSGVVPHDFPAAWELAMQMNLAALIGSGPVISLPIAERNDLRGQALTFMANLNSFNNAENVRNARVTRPREF